jgi:hypothetical protein
MHAVRRDCWLDDDAGIWERATRRAIGVGDPARDQTMLDFRRQVSQARYQRVSMARAVSLSSDA